MIYIERIRQWWPPSMVLKGLAVPGYAEQTMYNIVALSIWTSNVGTVGPANLWETPLNYIGG